MKYLLTNSCGHKQEYQLYGGANDRQRKAQWLKSQPCPKCRQEQSTRTLLEEQEAAIEREATRLLSALESDRDPRQAIRILRHKMREGMGTEVQREAVRRAVERYEAANGPDARGSL